MTTATLTNDANMLNAVVQQKGVILRLIAESEITPDVDNFNQAWKFICFAYPVWITAGYGYKIKEVANRLIGAIERFVKAEEEYLVNLRQNDKTRRMTERGIRDSLSLIEAVKGVL